VNIIVIVSDTYRYDNLAVGGGKALAHELDAFVSKSVSFDRCYISSFPTIPHRTDALTGTFGFPFYGWQPLDANLTTMGEVLQQNGYITQLICDTPHFLKRGYNFDRGFFGYHWTRGQEGDCPLTAMNYPIEQQMPYEKTRLSPMNFGHPLVDMHKWVNREWTWEEDRFAVKTCRTASKWLEENHKTDKFFLWVDCFDPHEPWDPPEYLVDLFDPGCEDTPMLHPNYGHASAYTPAELKNLQAHYRAEAKLVSKWVGHLLKKVEELQLLDDTVVVFTTDHGFFIGEHDRTGKSNISKEDERGAWPLYEEVSHIPLVVHFPGCKAKRVKEIAQPTDLMPTLLDLAGVKIPKQCHGKSLKPLLKGSKAKWPQRYAFSSTALTTAGRAEQPWTTVYDKNWAFFIGGKPEEKPELYDLRTDPTQTKNVLAKNPEVAKRMHNALLKFLKDLGTDEEKTASVAEF
ncbi:MAG: sulfatase-like hydrolase/transferase, partial [Armatimonadetes bacterium]|nr:sulfatase-like hydrolase/transferase [Armatimonadota bacterium]